MIEPAYKRYWFPLLKQIDPETAHHRTITALSWAQGNDAGRALLKRIRGDVPEKPVVVGMLRFPNVLGLAAGFDKDARVVLGLSLLGFGHVEVGTITPRPQSGNPRPRVFRLAEDSALINRMGFPNEGVEAIAARLAGLSRRDGDMVLGVSLGKQKETPLDDAADDYVCVMRAVYPYADYLAVNISSPNTPDLRRLQGGEYLHHLLRTLRDENADLAERNGLTRRPLWVKIAPDLSWPELDEILATIELVGIDGIIATNTTLARDGLNSAAGSETGGLSGRPLRERSTEFVAYIARATGGTLPIIGVGGVSTVDDIRRKLDAGASLVQLYTALAYEGPGLPGRLLREFGA